MGNHNHKLWVTLILLVMLGALVGCSVLSSPDPTPTASPQPTSTPPPTSTPTPLPTATPETPTDTPTPEPTESPFTLSLSEELYVHSNNLFELYPPEGWEVQEDDASVAFIDPDDVGFVSLQVTNTGYALDADAFANFIEAREANLFSTYEGYEEVDRQIDSSQGIASVEKSLLFEGTPQKVVTFYDQKGQAVYALDFWADTEAFEAFSPVFDDIFAGITVDSSVAATLQPYSWVFTLTGPENLYSIQVPTSWRYEVELGENALVETFYAPDDRALIQNLVYDEGVEISGTEGGQLALELLNTYYAPDIIITEDRIQPDGSERLTWYSPGGGYRGVSFLETRGTTFLLFTVMYDNEAQDIYLDVLEYTVSSYNVP